MIAMIMGDQEIIDLRDAGLMGGSQDAVGVAAFISGPTGIDEKGLACGRHDQSRLAALYIDEIDLQGLGRGGLRCPCGHDEHEYQTKGHQRTALYALFGT